MDHEHGLAGSYFPLLTEFLLSTWRLRKVLLLSFPFWFSELAKEKLNTCLFISAIYSGGGQSILLFGLICEARLSGLLIFCLSFNSKFLAFYAVSRENSKETLFPFRYRVLWASFIGGLSVCPLPGYREGCFSAFRNRNLAVELFWPILFWAYSKAYRFADHAGWNAHALVANPL
jgi:hypothetical protein